MGALELSDFELDVILRTLVVYQRKKLDAMEDIPEDERGSLSEAVERREQYPRRRVYYLGELIYKLQYAVIRRAVDADNAAKTESPS